jgi:hypothetical protein
MAEGFNNVVGTIKKQAYGFHDRDYLKLKILRTCGRVEQTSFATAILRGSRQASLEATLLLPR